MPSSTSWGIGELSDLRHLAAWMRGARLDRVMLLPIGTMAEGATSPYSASSAMAIDPIFIAVDRVDDFRRAGGVQALPDEMRDAIARVRRTARVEYSEIRRVKMAALDRAFERFVTDEWEALTVRGALLARYISRERWWLDDYALFKALERAARGRPWREWPEPIALRRPGAVDEARRRLGREVLREQYLQWLAETEWQEARRAAHEQGVTLFGDVPFMVEANSADVWARQSEFWLDATTGAPPDAFSATGQDWGVPVCRWDVMTAGGFEWIRDRARRMAALYDGFRIDHVIGFYRTYARPPHGEPFFTPGDEPTQLAQGETILRIFLQAGLDAGLHAGLDARLRAGVDTGAVVVAEDLGVLPSFMRASLNRLGVPGYRVLRWERRWHEPGQPFIDPASYPTASVVATGTHDTETMAAWWDGLSGDDRARLISLPVCRARGLDDPSRSFDAGVRDALLAAIYASASDELFVPIQDLFGWRDRINTPATVGDFNWTWKLHWPVDRIAHEPVAIQRAGFCGRLADGTGRAVRM